MKSVHRLTAAEIARLRSEDEKLCAEFDVILGAHTPRNARRGRK